MTASTAPSIEKINFLLEGAAVARANAVNGDIPAELRRMWLEDAEHMTACAHRLLDQLAVQRWITAIPLELVA